MNIKYHSTTLIAFSIESISDLLNSQQVSDRVEDKQFLNLTDNKQFEDDSLDEDGWVPQYTTKLGLSIKMRSMQEVKSANRCVG